MYKPKWTSVRDEIPECWDSEKYIWIKELVVKGIVKGSSNNSYPAKTVACFCGNGGTWSHDLSESFTITHWMEVNWPEEDQ